MNEARIFRGEIGTGQNIAQFYADDAVLLDSLTTFAAGGLIAGESLIIIATGEHLRALRERLICARIDLATAIIQDRYITLSAETALSAFMVGGWPDEKLFRNFISHLFDRAAANHRCVRAFGEMVALLWARGHSAATLQLERLWNEFCKKGRLSLFCAYPASGFKEDDAQTLAEICAVHSKVIEPPGVQKARVADSLEQPQAAD